MPPKGKSLQHNWKALTVTAMRLQILVMNPHNPPKKKDSGKQALRDFQEDRSGLEGDTV